ncbi:2-dehydro-3-deoxygalactonokinase [Marinovum sp. 2_MG-2023]|uniref:2-dehydro-3-deoxygalactonokinase n=1 Tax=unclassified Marinovum TaxID=2647166 RepID=UPI0026E136B2|nr:MULTISPECIES: 2-dehydro-3-deoxygalactonokinase [unclassified Marinovum]MDO6732928.1 2-dehydro-3-deoxygalactonokinase [Marinovum sp. 2_MG-2023]MDO6782192.1 2-dehydro-3-deoxygalactonokinase [Marinovum sp. 1_MG-2023]
MTHSDLAPWPLAVFDWGTSNLRAYAVQEDGTILGRVAGRGAKQTEREEFSRAYDRTLMRLHRKYGCEQALLVGMVGSNLGWVDVDMCTAPQTRATVQARLVPVAGTGAHIVPGVSAKSIGGFPDMMRGEEVQVFGALALAARDDALLCLPGTHSKWVTCEQGAICRISTAMTGEIFDLLCHASVLKGHVTSELGGTGLAGFDDGIEAAKSNLGVSLLAFSTRPRALLSGAVNPVDGRGYLSGVLIGSEILSMQQASGAQDVLIVGEPELARFYARAAGALNMAARVIDGAAAIAAGAAAIHHARLAAVSGVNS